MKRYRVTYVDYAHAESADDAVAIVQASITSGEVSMLEFCDVQEAEEDPEDAGEETRS